MSGMRAHALNLAIAIVLALIWVFFAGAMAWGAFSEQASTRYVAFALASPFALAGAVVPDSVAVPGGIAIMIVVCFVVVSTLSLLLRRRKAHET
jgi:hypothetical protein